MKFALTPHYSVLLCSLSILSVLTLPYQPYLFCVSWPCILKDNYLCVCHYGSEKWTGLLNMICDFLCISYSPVDIYIGVICVECSVEYWSIIFFLLNYFLHSIFHSPALSSTLPLVHIPHLLPPPVSTWMSPLPPHLASKFSKSSSLLRVRCIISESRPRSLLLYVCWGLHISLCMLSAWWSSVWEILGV